MCLGCCDVISDSDVNTIKILIELCNNLNEKPYVKNAPPLSKDAIAQCRNKILSTCGIDIELVLHPEVRLGQAVKKILNDVRSLNASLCLKYNFGVQPWRLGVPHRVTVNFAKTASKLKIHFNVLTTVLLSTSCFYITCQYN